METESLKVLTDALKRMTVIGVKTATRYAYYEGNHPDRITSEAWRTSWAPLVAHIKDNQIKYCIDKRVAALKPSAVETTGDDVYNRAWATWGTAWIKKNKAMLLTVIRNAKISGVRTTVLIDYDTLGNVVPIALDPRSVYTRTDAGGNELYTVYVWREDEEDARTHISVFYPDHIDVYRSTSDNRIPAVDSFKYIETVNHPRGLCPVITIEPDGTVIDEAIPLQDELNDAKRHQAVASRKWVEQLRVWEGYETYDEETNQMRTDMPELSPTKRAADIALPPADGEGRSTVHQFEGPNPDPLQKQQESALLSIYRQFDIPSFLLQVGGNPESAEALEIQLISYLESVGDDRDLYGPFLRRVVQLAVSKEIYRLMGSYTPAPELSIRFDPAAQLPLTARATVAARMVEAGLPLDEALVEFMDYPRERAKQIMALVEERNNQSLAAQLSAFDAGAV